MVFVFLCITSFILIYCCISDRLCLCMVSGCLLLFYKNYNFFVWLVSITSPSFIALHLAEIAEYLTQVVSCCYVYYAYVLCVY